MTLRGKGHWSQYPVAQYNRNKITRLVPKSLEKELRIPLPVLADSLDEPSDPNWRERWKITDADRDRPEDERWATRRFRELRRMNVLIPSEMSALLGGIAAGEGYSKSQFATKIIVEYLESRGIDCSAFREEVFTPKVMKEVNTRRERQAMGTVDTGRPAARP